MRQRWWFLSGVGFSILLVVGFILATGTFPEDNKAPDADWIKVLSSSSDRAKIIAGAYVMFVAGLLFLWFAASIRADVRARQSKPSVLSTVSIASAIVFVSMLLIGALAVAAVPASITFGDGPVPGADFIRQFSQLGIGAILAPGGLAAALFVASTSRLGVVTGLFSRGLAIVGYVAAVLLVFGAMFLPFLALPLWAIIVGIALARQATPATASEVPTSSASTTTAV